MRQRRERAVAAWAAAGGGVAVNGGGGASTGADDEGSLAMFMMDVVLPFQAGGILRTLLPGARAKPWCFLYTRKCLSLHLSVENNHPTGV
jgi:hypothetical protein